MDLIKHVVINHHEVYTSNYAMEYKTEKSIFDFMFGKKYIRLFNSNLLPGEYFALTKSGIIAVSNPTQILLDNERVVNLIIAGEFRKIFTELGYLKEITYGNKSIRF